MGEGPADDEGDQDRDDGDQQPLAELLEMLEERHLRKLALFFRRSESLSERIGHAGLTASVCSTGMAFTGSSLDTTSAAGVMFVESCLSSSTCTSRSMVFFSSSVAFLNSPRAFPRVRPISGRRFGPNTSRATMKMTINSGMPSEPNMNCPFCHKSNRDCLANTPPL